VSVECAVRWHGKNGHDFQADATLKSLEIHPGSCPDAEQVQLMPK